MTRKIIIVGGGLWGGLLGWYLQHRKPETDFVIYEKGQTLGGNHTWSFHEPDVGNEGMSMLRPFIRKSWDRYDVNFPDLTRTIEIPYHSISSELFDKSLREFIPPEKIKLNTSITIEEAQKLGDIVFDCRGIQVDGNCGYQKFFGVELRLKHPHNLTHPVLMEARVPQIDGFRFIYLLPYDERTLLIEDTRYSSGPELDSKEMKKLILNFTEVKGWEIDEMIREEVGVLPIPFTIPAPKALGNVIDFSGIFHDTTGYSLPDAVKLIDKITTSDFSQEELLEKVETYRFQRTSNRSFFCFLNNMMFFASEDQERYKTLEFFYRGRKQLIEKFYAGEMSSWDKITFFIGKPPVNITKAILAMKRSFL